MARAVRRASASTASSTWRPRPACATRSRTRTPTSTATSSASSTSSKAAATPASSTWSMRRSSSVYGGNTQHAVLRARQRRPPGQPVRRHQEGQRADGPHLQPPVRPADHGPALLHGVRALGPAGHGAVPVHQGDPRRPRRSTSSTTARCCATSPTSTTSSKAWSACSTGRATADPAFDPAQPDPARSNAPYRVFNIGNNQPVQLMDFIEALEQALGRKAEKNLLPMQDGDVPATYADVAELVGLDRLQAGHAGARGRGALRRTGTATTSARSVERSDAHFRERNDEHHHRCHRPGLCRPAAGRRVRQEVARPSASTCRAEKVAAYQRGIDPTGEVSAEDLRAGHAC